MIKWIIYYSDHIKNATRQQHTLSLHVKILISAFINSNLKRQHHLDRLSTEPQQASKQEQGELVLFAFNERQERKKRANILFYSNGDIPSN